MYIDFTSLSPNAAYFTIVQSLIPRPIAWVLTENDHGHFNLAPFSYFTAVSSKPPLLMISLGKKPDGSAKDSRVNLEKRRQCVVHIASQDQLDALNASSKSCVADISEVDTLDLELTEFTGFDLPRLQACPLAFACDLYEIQEMGDTPQALIFLLIKGLYVADEVGELVGEKARLKIDAQRVDPIARLGAGEYAGLGDLTLLKRPL